MRYWGRSTGEGSCSDDTVPNLIAPYTTPGEMQGIISTLPASLFQTAEHHLMGTQQLPDCIRLTPVLKCLSSDKPASDSFGWKVKLSHQAKLFLKLLGSLPSTTHLLPWRGVLITSLPPGEDNDCATGHAEPAGPLSSDPHADHWDFNKPLWEAEKQGKMKPEATQIPHTVISLCRNLRGYREV